MGNLRAQFEAYGADYDATMERFMGNEDMYRRILGMLFQDGCAEQIEAALAAGDLTAAFQAAHTLKGVAGNLGLTPLYGAVSALVEPLRRGEGAEAPALYAAVRIALEQAALFYGAVKEGQ